MAWGFWLIVLFHLCRHAQALDSEYRLTSRGLSFGPEGAVSLSPSAVALAEAGSPGYDAWTKELRSAVEYWFKTSQTPLRISAAKLNE